MPKATPITTPITTRDIRDPETAAPANTLKVKRLHPDVQMPKYQTAGAACFDIHAFEPDWVIHRHVREREPLTVETGLSFEVPDGFVMLVYSRSGQGFNSDVRLANCVGVVDSDYRGPLRVKLTSDNAERAFKVDHGDRVAQAMLVPVQQWELQEVDALSETARGDGAYGSTGVK